MALLRLWSHISNNVLLVCQFFCPKRMVKTIIDIPVVVKDVVGQQLARGWAELREQDQNKWQSGQTGHPCGYVNKEN